jgi:histone H3/H4
MSTYENTQGLTKPAFLRIARQAGVKRMSGLTYKELRDVTEEHMENVIRASMMYMEHDRRKTLGLNDVIRGIEDQGDKLAFSNAMKKAVRRCHG